MKRIYTIIVAVLITASVFAQAPQKMTYQAVVRNASNNLVTSTQVGIQIKIRQDSITGTAVYTETQTPTTNSNGLLTIEIGGQTGFDLIDWANGPFFIETNIDVNGGTNYTITGTNQLLSVPYALYANNVKLNKNGEALELYINDNGDLLAVKIINDPLGETCSSNPTVTDYDGNVYNTVQIGNQCWMKENLKVTHYPNGDAIPNITDNNYWGNLADINTYDAYCYYNNNANSEADAYGALYTYAAAIADNWQKDNDTQDTTGGQGICPDGWHLPTDTEWAELEDYLGKNIAGGRMKEIGTTHWNTPNNDATNLSGFSAFPGGNRNFYNGTFSHLGFNGYWWSATESGSGAYSRNLYYIYTYVNSYNYDKSYGFSVRCVRD